MRIMAILVLAAATSLVGCNVKKEKKKESYSYDLTENGCATGKHTFSSVGAMCSALADNATNKGCAFTLRYQMAQQYKCPQVSPKGNGASPSEAGSQPISEATVRYTYQYIVNGCDTGRQTFTSKEAYCAGLANEQLNNNCAADLRRQAAIEKGCR